MAMAMAMAMAMPMPMAMARDCDQRRGCDEDHRRGRSKRPRWCAGECHRKVRRAVGVGGICVVAPTAVPVQVKVTRWQLSWLMPVSISETGRPGLVPVPLAATSIDPVKPVWRRSRLVVGHAAGDVTSAMDSDVTVIGSLRWLCTV
jgi:hypothetical protein